MLSSAVGSVIRQARLDRNNKAPGPPANNTGGTGGLHDSPLEEDGCELLVRGRGEIRLSPLLCGPVARTTRCAGADAAVQLVGCELLVRGRGEIRLSPLLCGPVARTTRCAGADAAVQLVLSAPISAPARA